MINLSEYNVINSMILFLDSEPAKSANKLKLQDVERALKSSFAVIYDAWESFSHNSIEINDEQKKFCKLASVTSICKWACQSQSNYLWIFNYYSECCKRSGEFDGHKMFQWFTLCQYPFPPEGVFNYHSLEYPLINGECCTVRSRQLYGSLNTEMV